MKEEMERKTASGIMLTLLLISMFGFVRNVQPVKVRLKTVYVDDDNAVNPWNGNLEHSYQDLANRIERISTNDIGSTNNGTYYYEERSKNARVIEHKITTFEWKEWKQKVGVWEENRNYDKTINGHGTGLRPPTEEEWLEIAGGTYVVEQVLLTQTAGSPSSVDHTVGPWFPPIGNQDGEGSCVAWAVGYYTKTFQEAKEHGWNLSGAEWVGGYYGYPTPAYQDRIFSPDFIYHLINGGVDGGSYFYDAINLVCAIGASSWEKMPYDPGDSTSWPPEDSWEEAPLYRGNSSGYEYLELNMDNDLMSLKNWIASDHLAVIAVDADQYSGLASEDIWTLDNYANPDTDHANTIVGYDDNIEYTEEGELRYGAFKIANSWGEGGWENIPDGCYWISYEAMKQRVEYCMFYRDKIGYGPELVSSFRIDHSKRGECDVLIGMGSHSSPVATKSFSDLIDGGDFPFCSNNIVFDITEFKDVVPTVYNQSFFIRVFDGGSVTTGTITDFSIQHAVSEDPPITTANGNYVLADVVLPNTIRVPLHYATIQGAINAVVLGLDEDPGVTIQVASGTCYEHVVVDKTVSIVGENRNRTIVDGQTSGSPVFNVTANNACIANLTIRHAFTGSNAFGSVHLTSDGNHIINNILEVIMVAIFLYNSNDNEIAGNVMRDRFEELPGIGIRILSSSNNMIARNNITFHSGIQFLPWGLESYHNVIEGNYIGKGAYCGLQYSTNCPNFVVGNIFEDNEYGIDLTNSNGSIQENIFLNNKVGIRCYGKNNSIFHNIFVNNTDYGVYLHSASNNKFYHNNFIDNTKHVHIPTSGYTNFWDNGYPYGGNYWSDYAVVDLYSGPYQNETGSDGIGDTPYVIGTNNTDRYPLMKPFGVQHDIGITNIITSRTVIGKGYSLYISIRIVNYGVNTENFTVTAYANSATIATLTSITLTRRSSITIAFTWNTTGVAKSNYIIGANATPVSGETDTTDNTHTDGSVTVTGIGDVNGDFTVNILDVILILINAGPVPPKPPEYDVNCDGTNNILDVILCFINAGPCQ